VGLRTFLQDWAATKLESPHPAADPPAPTLQALTALLSGLPLVHQEIAFLTLAGYSRGTLEKIFGLLLLWRARGGAAARQLRPVTGTK